jgi:hypothetical protein
MLRSDVALTSPTSIERVATYTTAGTPSPAAARRVRGGGLTWMTTFCKAHVSFDATEFTYSSGLFSG